MSDLLEETTGESSVRSTGPPAKRLRIRSDLGLVLAFEFTRTDRRALLANVHGEPVWPTTRAPRESPVRVGQPLVAEDDQTALDWAAEQAKELAGEHPENLVGVGVSIAGPVDKTRNTLRGGTRGEPVMPRWAGTRIRKEFEQRLFDWNPPIHVHNDATLGAMAEHIWGAGQGYDEMVYVEWDIGVGAGIISGGQIIDGQSGGAGELGHLPAFQIRDEDRAPKPCRHCHQDCIESLAGAAAIARYLDRAQGKQHVPPEPHDLPTRLRAVLDRAGEDLAVQEALHCAAHYLGQGLVYVVNLFNPGVIVLGGGIQPSVYRYVNPAINKVLQDHANTSLYSEVEVIAGALKRHASLRGAAALVLECELVDFLIDRMRGSSANGHIRAGAPPSVEEPV